MPEKYVPIKSKYHGRKHRSKGSGKENDNAQSQTSPNEEKDADDNDVQRGLTGKPMMKRMWVAILQGTQVEIPSPNLPQISS